MLSTQVDFKILIIISCVLFITHRNMGDLQALYQANFRSANFMVSRSLYLSLNVGLVNALAI